MRRTSHESRLTHHVSLILLLALLVPARCDDLGKLDDDRVSKAEIPVEIVFPVKGGSFGSDSFLAPRSGGTRHHGQDLFGRKMQELVAAFDGVVYFGPRQGKSGNTLTIFGDCGWVANYRHINNDTPGTNDGKGTDKDAYSPDIRNGGRVKAGQVVAFMGDSGNAEGGTPHLHFELVDRETGAIINPAPSLRAAKKRVGHAELVSASKPVPAEKKPGPGPASKALLPDDPRSANGSLDLLPNEIAVIGKITSIDLDQGELVMEAIVVSRKANTYEGVGAHRQKVVRLFSNTVAKDIDDPGKGILLPELRVGQEVTVIGRNFGTGTVLPARVIAVVVKG